jgi:hypothetical protein
MLLHVPVNRDVTRNYSQPCLKMISKKAHFIGLKSEMFSKIIYYFEPFPF